VIFYVPRNNLACFLFITFVSGDEFMKKLFLELSIYVFLFSPGSMEEKKNNGGKSI
jgi:hypothetical protein